MRALLDHLGYFADDQKLVLIEAPEATEWQSVVVTRRPDGEPVLRIQPVFAGRVDGWSAGPWWSVDLSSLEAPGHYAIEWTTGDGNGHSETLEIRDTTDDREQLVSDIVHYIKGQRCSGIWDAADRSAPRAGDGARRDVHGGWYDASGDYSKYMSHLSYANFMNPQQAPLTVWVLAHAWRRGRDGGMPPLLLERIRDEALYGAEWLVRMLDPEGFWYVTVFDRWSKDPAERMLCSYRTQLGERGDDYQAGWRQGGGMAAAALAVASTLDPSRNDLRDAALTGFEHLRANGIAYLDDGRENVIDDTCALLAACELHDAGAAAASVMSELELRLDHLLARRQETDGLVWLRADDAGGRSWFHASDAGLPVIALLRAATIVASDEAVALAGELIAAQLDLAHRQSNPFGYPPHWVRTPEQPGHVQWFYPHDNPSGYWWQGENARLASLASAAHAFAERSPQHRLAAAARPAARQWTSWITGRNPFDVCMLHGYGRNNPTYEPGFPNAPGGVCNGITSGVDDENDIAFRPMPYANDRLHSWRWGEQWMPHATWLLHAEVMRSWAPA